MKPWLINVYRVLFLALLLGAWELASGRLFDSFWLSQPSHIALWIWKSYQSGELMGDLRVTFAAAAYGFVAGAIGGLILGLVLAQSETIAEVLRPFILAVYGIPRIALAPVFVLWFGIGMYSKVVMAGTMTLLLVFFSTFDGIRAADVELRNVARVLGANRWQLFRYVTLPNAMPWIISGLRISIPQALVAAVMAEFIASTAGIGYRIMSTTNTLDTAGTMAGIVILMVLVVGLNELLDKFEARVMRWRPPSAEPASH
jgi:NitT/TauT family transport system permease protein